VLSDARRASLPSCLRAITEVRRIVFHSTSKKELTPNFRKEVGRGLNPLKKIIVVQKEKENNTNN
jgi:hypothetical protein